MLIAKPASSIFAPPAFTFAVRPFRGEKKEGLLAPARRMPPLKLLVESWVALMRVLLKPPTVRVPPFRLSVVVAVERLTLWRSRLFAPVERLALFWMLTVIEP